MRRLKKGWITYDWKKWQIKDRDKTVEKTIEKLAPPWVNTKKRMCEITNYSDKEDWKLNKPLMREEFERALRYTKDKSSPGSDGVEYALMKQAPEKYKKELLKIINYCFEKGKMIKDWKVNQTIFIDKGNKKKVRPITMSSCVSKVMERIINERIMWWAENSGILDTWQNGFRRGRSCMDNLARVRMKVEITARTGEEVITAFLDVNSAYDRVIRDCLVDKLREEKCPYKITRYIEEWMTDRETTFIVNKECKQKYKVNRGLP